MVRCGRSRPPMVATPMCRTGPDDVIGTVLSPGSSGVSAMEGISETPVPAATSERAKK
ncbi:hypothetical protein SNE510_29800 [Streptomyces sp. NE5-10]|nr:hypothetical protein SNE510_29800 [Streptomyces sp. NE5-10]